MPQALGNPEDQEGGEHLTSENHHGMMRHKKTPSSEEASDDRLYPRPAPIETVDILAGNLRKKSRKRVRYKHPIMSTLKP